LAARIAPVDVRPGPSDPVERPDAVTEYRPRPRQLAPPVGDAFSRIGQLTAPSAGGGHGSMKRADPVSLEPAAAASAIIAALRSWEYVGEGVPPAPPRLQH
jgi:hypothetical protein